MPTVVEVEDEAVGSLWQGWQPTPSQWRDRFNAPDESTASTRTIEQMQETNYLQSYAGPSMFAAPLEIVNTGGATSSQRRATLVSERSSDRSGI